MPAECTRSRGWLVSEAGDVVAARCNTYACESCGPRKARRLGRAIADWVETHCTGGASFWTFTLTNRFSRSVDEHRRQMAKAWHYLWREIRRTLLLSPKQRGAQYISVVEAHQSGFVHRHALVDVYLPQRLLQAIWESACRHALGVEDPKAHVGFCFVRFVPQGGRQVARYVAKYVTKSARTFHDLFTRAHVWSRSRGVVLDLKPPRRRDGVRWYFAPDARCAFDLASGPAEDFRARDP